VRSTFALVEQPSRAESPAQVWRPAPHLLREACRDGDADGGSVKGFQELDQIPYMHDGMKTLEEVVDFFDKGGIPDKSLDRFWRYRAAWEF